MAFGYTQPQSATNLHSQESGAAGFCCNMEHQCSEEYKGSDHPVQEEGSFVKPIPKENLGTSGFPLMMGNVPSLSGFRLKPESPFPEPQVQKPPAVEETKWLTSLVDNEVHVTAMTKGIRYRTKGAWKTGARMLFLCLVINLLDVSEGAPVHSAPAAEKQAFNCFTCKVKEECKQIDKIFHMKYVYEKDEIESVPECPSPPAPGTCTMCSVQSEIYIYCTKNITKVQAEGGGNQISTESCECPATPNHGLNLTSHADSFLNKYYWQIVVGVPVVTGLVLIVIVVVAVKCDHRGRTDQPDQSSEAFEMQRLTTESDPAPQGGRILPGAA